MIPNGAIAAPLRRHCGAIAARFPEDLGSLSKGRFVFLGKIRCSFLTPRKYDTCFIWTRMNTALARGRCTASISRDVGL